jgi:hypothetical protein
MRDTAAFHYACDFQAHWAGIEVVEIADAGTKQHRHQIDMDFVEQPSFQALLRDAGASEADIPSRPLTAVLAVPRLQHRR